MGSTLTVVPRRPIHPHRLGSNLSFSKTLSEAADVFSDELDQIPTSHLVKHVLYAAIQHRLCCVDITHDPCAVNDNLV